MKVQSQAELYRDSWESSGGTSWQAEPAKEEICAQVPASGVLCAHLGQFSLPQCLWEGFEEEHSFKETFLW